MAPVVEKNAFNGNVRRALNRAVSTLGVLKNTYAPKFDDAIVQLLSPEEQAIVGGLITYLQGKIAARIPHQ